VSEVRTPAVEAKHIPDKEAFRDEYYQGRVPGSFRVTEQDEFGEITFWYCCPCGCKSIGPLTVGRGVKPNVEGVPTWNWNGSLEKPTLSPSVHHVGHWHGWLRNGVWESV